MVQSPGWLRLQKTKNSSQDPCESLCGTRRKRQAGCSAEGAAEPHRPADSSGVAEVSPLDRGKNHRAGWRTLRIPERARWRGPKAERDTHRPVRSQAVRGRSQGGSLGLGVRIKGRVPSTWRRTQWLPEASEGPLRTGPISLTLLPL